MFFTGWWRDVFALTPSPFFPLATHDCFCFERYLKVFFLAGRSRAERAGFYWLYFVPCLLPSPSFKSFNSCGPSIDLVCVVETSCGEIELESTWWKPKLLRLSKFAFAFLLIYQPKLETLSSTELLLSTKSFALEIAKSTTPRGKQSRRDSNALSMN